MIAEEGKAGRKIGEKWSAILVPSPAASNTPSGGWNKGYRFAEAARALEVGPNVL
jgi:hypothetical protein